MQYIAGCLVSKMKLMIYWSKNLNLYTGILFPVTLREKQRKQPTLFLCVGSVFLSKLNYDEKSIYRKYFFKKFERNKNSYANQNFSPRRNQQFIPDSWAAESWFHNFPSRENIAVFPGGISQGCQLSPNEIGSFDTFSHVFSCIC